MTNPAESYESYIVPALFSPWASRLVAGAQLSPGHRILDVACGTGIVARKAAAAAPGGKVAGIDPSPAMLGQARLASEREGLDIEWHEGKAESLPFPDRSFDVVLCQQGAQFFSDRPAGLAEMHRVLDAGGRCHISLWRNIERHTFFQALDRAIQTHLGAKAVQTPFSLGDAEELRRLMAATGFEDISIEEVSMEAHYPDPERFLYETVNALQAVVPALQGQGAADAHAAVRADMEAPLREFTRGAEIVLPWHAHIARGVKR